MKLSKDPGAIGALAEQMLGYNLVTKQTTAAGSPVSNVMVAKALNIVKETYLAIVLDRFDRNRCSVKYGHHSLQ